MSGTCTVWESSSYKDDGTSWLLLEAVTLQEDSEKLWVMGHQSKLSIASQRVSLAACSETHLPKLGKRKLEKQVPDLLRATGP